tara:strand:+ start:627 stop:860 length:234 start_codon:yes stop_codon:yes gene_type:complete
MCHGLLEGKLNKRCSIKSTAWSSSLFVEILLNALRQSTINFLNALVFTKASNIGLKILTMMFLLDTFQLYTNTLMLA